MKGIFDDKYIVDVTNINMAGDCLVLSVTFSGRDYPDFINHLDSKFLKKQAIYYQDDHLKGQFIIKSSSFSGEPLDDEVRDMLNLEAQRNGHIHFHERRDFWNYIFEGSMTLKFTEDQTTQKCVERTE